MNLRETHKYMAIIAFCFLSYFANSGEAIDISKEKELPKIASSKARSEIKVCTQNIFRLGDKGTDSRDFKVQLEFLVDRISTAGCAVVALQEVAGNIEQSEKIVTKLSYALNTRTNKSEFKQILGSSNDPFIRNAFIYDSNELKLLNSRSLYHDSLPRLSSRSAPWSYVRGPLMAEFRLSEHAKEKKELVLINYHLKSKSRGYKDKAGLDFEISRLLSAGGIRERIDEFMRENREDYVEVLLGDRNADSDSATSKVLSGELDIDDFRGFESCEIMKSGEPVCEAQHYSQASFIAVLEHKNQAEGLDLNTYSYRKKSSILDEIYISHEDFARTLDLNKQIRAGIVGDFKKGSDHLLSWVEIKLD